MIGKTKSDGNKRSEFVLAYLYSSRPVRALRSMFSIKIPSAAQRQVRRIWGISIDNPAWEKGGIPLFLESRGIMVDFG